ncbi:ferritin [Candidatus Aerophobetes bacterium]|nr:ferritin [Candidatus Aerophobetes bacterium]
MGQKGKEIVGVNLDELIDRLNKALADEWLAYYQYWIGARVVKGAMRQAVVAELEEHANDELKHAGMIVDRILQLDGKPILKPEDWYKLTNCGYDAPEDSSVKTALEQNIKGEQCAIDVYSKLVDFTKEKDVITYNMVVGILQDEIEHEDDLQTLLEDIEKK